MDKAEQAARKEYNVRKDDYPELSSDEFYLLQLQSIIRKHAFVAGYRQAEKDLASHKESNPL